jgi:hypothetical protein
LGSAWFSFRLLEIGAAQAIPDAVRETVLVVLPTAGFILAVADWFVYRSINRDT